MIERVLTAIDESARAVTPGATRELRRSALSSGWSRQAASELRVTYSRNEWSVEIGDQAADFEYGSPDQVPNAAVRRFSNRTETLEDRFLHVLSAKTKGIL